MTKGEIDRLGERISTSKVVSADDLNMLQEFRKSYSDALSHMFESIKEAAIKVDEKTIVTFRIKRIDTIIRKLQRFAGSKHGSMKLSRMWDIAGCRCILFNLIEDKIYRMADEISEIDGIDEKTEGNDYVLQAKPDGYRSYHMYVEHKDYKKPIEIQIRNKTMHTWATLVEIFDLLFGLGIKEGNKNNILQDFLLLYSRKDELSPLERERFIKIEQEKQIFKSICDAFAKNYAKVRQQWASRSQGANYLVIEAGKDYPTTINAFTNFNEAEDYYYTQYLENRPNTNIVLVYSAKSDFSQISFAYSNYILSTHDFFYDYKNILEQKIIDSVRADNFKLTEKMCDVYKDIVLKYQECQTEELYELTNVIKHQKQIKQRYVAEWKKDFREENDAMIPKNTDFMKRLHNVVNKCSHKYKFNNYFADYFVDLNESIKKIKGNK